MEDEDKKLDIAVDIAVMYLKGKLGFPWLRDAVNDYIETRGHDDDVKDPVNLRARLSAVTDIWLSVEDEQESVRNPRLSEEQMRKLSDELHLIAEKPHLGRSRGHSS